MSLKKELLAIITGACSVVLAIALVCGGLPYIIYKLSLTVILLVSAGCIAEVVLLCVYMCLKGTFDTPMLGSTK